MIYLNIGLVLVAGAALGVLFSRRVIASPAWHATVTPLASIIGSGFLVSVPLLAGAIGNYALLGMAGLVVFAFLVGGAIRFNIAHGEPLFDATQDEARAGKSAPVGRSSKIGATAAAVEHLSHIALAGAYFVSVAYYLSLLSIFLLKGVGVQDALLARAITSAFLVFIGGFGLLRGLKGLERLEEYAVGFKLAVIAAILVALGVHNAQLAASGEWALRDLPARFDFDTLRVLFGFVIVVQGFETSRFLAGQYPPALRVRTMRRAQIVSGAIYLAFFALATVMFQAKFADGEVAAIIDMVAKVAWVLPIMLTAAAVASQFSASMADAIGAAGILHAAFAQRYALRYFYPVIAAVAIALVWSGSVFDIIADASRAFALYYFLQCLVAALLACTAPDIGHRILRATWFGALAALSLAAAVLGIPSAG